MAIKESSHVFLSDVVLLFLSLVLVVSADFTKDTPKKKVHCLDNKCEDTPCRFMFGQAKEEFEGGNYINEEEENNPYVFNNEDFITLLKTELGSDTILPKFTDNRSEKLRGVENFRIRLVEACPRTLGPPIHAEAHALMVVVKGRGSMHLVTNKRHSFSIELGDIFMVPSGVTSYMVNCDGKENLTLLNLLVPISTPGHFETFAMVGSNKPGSLYSAFSWEVLEAAFKTYREKFERVFNQTKRGFLKATREQIDALTPRSEGAYVSSESSFNLLGKRATHGNEFGRLVEADGHDYKPLRELDVVVSFTNITKGAMVAPYYNSMAPTIAFVLEGEGMMEMGGPHNEGALIETDDSNGDVSCGSLVKRSSGRVSARLREGTVFVVPAGRPIVFFDFGNQTSSPNLKILAFVVNVKGNVRVPLAGKNNMVSLMNEEAKELIFNVPASEVDSVFCKQEEEFFLPGPKKEHCPQKMHWPI